MSRRLTHAEEQIAQEIVDTITIGYMGWLLEPHSLTYMALEAQQMSHASHAEDPSVEPDWAWEAYPIEKVGRSREKTASGHIVLRPESINGITIEYDEQPPFIRSWVDFEPGGCMRV